MSNERPQHRVPAGSGSNQRVAASLGVAPWTSRWLNWLKWTMFVSKMLEKLEIDKHMLETGSGF